MKDALMTSIVLKPGITLLDIVSTRMLGQVGFMATVFDIFNSNGISVDVVATSEVSISLTLDPRLASPTLPSRPPPSTWVPFCCSCASLQARLQVLQSCSNHL